MSDKIKVMESIALRGMAKYGNIKRGIRDMQTIDDYATDSASGQSTGEVLATYLNKQPKTDTKVLSVLDKIVNRLDALEAK
tara:strand:- start:96 stop:338 length:243 start_codon:yes stop_codon:yes gene_type:complete